MTTLNAWPEHDTAPCVRDGEHHAEQRHPFAECPTYSPASDDDLRPATDAEEQEHISGYKIIPGAVETEHGILVPVDYGRVERTARSYDPALDLARVDEATVRRLVGIGVPLKGVGTIVLQGRFTPGGRGCYGAVYVMCHRPNKYHPEECYSTHQAIVRAEDGSEPVVFAEAGHYDQTRAQAEADLRSR